MFEYPEVEPNVLSAIHDASVAIVVGHISPDGDCIHSQIAMAKLLQSLSVEVHLVNAGPFSRKEISEYEPLFARHVDPQLKEKNPLVVMVDCSTLDRIGYIGDEIQGLTTLVVDHHASGSRFGDITYIVPKSFSTTLCIMQLYKALEVKLTHEIAEHIFFGFATDTGFFKFIGPYRGETFNLVAQLVETGVSPNEVYNRMEGGHTLSSRLYLGKLLSSTTPLFEGKVMMAIEEKGVFTDYDASDRPSDSLYSQLLGIEGVQAVLYIKHLEGDSWEVGFRASHNSNVDVGKIAASFGGGGHKKAAGATIKLPLEALKAKLFPLIEGQLI
ncbi:MAG: recombinase RecJ [Spirochaetia bacterium]|nr:recombinase RecJ [Spirochaetia bacterium]